VVFASAKDRRPTSAGGRLHTNFKLSNGGEYLALFDAGSPRAPMTEFRGDYPEQRNDYSYGTDPSGSWRYFQVPTPGQPNGTSSITGVVPKPDVSHKRGWYETPFTLALTNKIPGTTIRFTTDGSIPTETAGTIYSGPIAVSSNLVLRAMEVEPDVKAGVIWAGAVYSYDDFEKYAITDTSFVAPSTETPGSRRSREIFETYGRPDTTVPFWQAVSLTLNIEYLEHPVQIHHAVDDDVVNVGYSRDLAAVLQANGKTYEAYEYPSGGHNISSPSFELAMQRTIAFFRANL
jgi:hypothetical protein